MENISKTIMLLSFLSFGVCVAVAGEKKVYSPGFDCNSGHLGRVETLICNDNELSRRDFLLNQLYSLATQRIERSGELKESQRNWMSKVRNRCDTVECLKRIYEGREIYLGMLVLPTGDLEIQFEFSGSKELRRAWRSSDPNKLVKDANGIFAYRNESKNVVISCDSVWENHAGTINSGYGGICWADINGQLNEYYLCSNEVTFNYEPVTIRNEYMAVRYLNDNCYGG